MPTYLYQTLHDDGTEGEVFECTHAMHDTLEVHPVSGERVRRVYSAPNLATRYTPGHTRKLLSNENLERKGFTKYQKDKVSGKYHKVVGEGPGVIDRPPAGSL